MYAMVNEYLSTCVTDKFMREPEFILLYVCAVMRILHLRCMSLTFILQIKCL
jgi:hypothetical protein